MKGLLYRARVFKRPRISKWNFVVVEVWGNVSRVSTDKISVHQVTLLLGRVVRE